MNPWEAAGAELARQQSAAAPKRAVPVAAANVPWVAQDERSGARFAKRLGRGVLWTVVALAAITGVRSWVVPAKAPAPAAAPPVQAGPTYPDNEAQAVAARFARAYLAWDETKAPERAALLAAVLLAGADTAMGWNGHGRQDVLTVEPGSVTPGKYGQARVRVDVLIQAPGAKTAASPARWVGLDVPVVETSGRVVVSGRPGFVGIPTDGPRAPEIPAPEADAELSSQTTATVGKFFEALAGAGDVDAVTAPGAKVPPLPGGVTYKALTSWTVDIGTGADRTGTAVVTWALGSATIEQAYRVELTRVSSADAQRWQVAGARGGSL
ncbi:hypothetical protein ACFVZH_38125 [Streptomyces sp. NPDC059534]|uniref:hypothetical protein n=1 Tax=Streptomyces sp. NPDC059534 TaxID=3346859 RepID=UPI0036A1E911